MEVSGNLETEFNQKGLDVLLCPETIPSLTAALFDDF